jgi:hypothetical protein
MTKRPGWASRSAAKLILEGRGAGMDNWPRWGKQVKGMAMLGEKPAPMPSPVVSPSIA